MAFSAVRSFSQLTTKLISSCKLRSNKILNLANPVGVKCVQGSYARSICHLNMNRDNHHVGLTLSLTTKSSLSKTCGCCHVHTEADRELGEFLKEEIRVEKGLEKSEGQLPRIKGYELEISGAEVTLKKQKDQETIVVTFNINNSVDADDDFEMTEQDPEKPPEMISKPSFVVEMNKGGPTTLAFQCSFPVQGEDLPPEGEEQYDDVIELNEVALIPTGKDWQDNTYCVSASIMDGNLYDLLLNMLEDRGIDAEFADQLVEFSTALDHKKYMDFLEELSSFTNK